MRVRVDGSMARQGVFGYACTKRGSLVVSLLVHRSSTECISWPPSFWCMKLMGSDLMSILT
jgi:hypothetical protein